MDYSSVGPPQHSPTSGQWQRVQFPSAGGPGDPPVPLIGRMAGFDDHLRHPAVLLLHPNPAHGGTMDSKILRAIADTLYPLGVGSLRYNSRGVGGSGGEILVEPGTVGDMSWVRGTWET